MDNKYKPSNVTVLDLFVIMFVALKLCHVIDWSWWIVFFPWIAVFVIQVIILIVSKLRK